MAKEPGYRRVSRRGNEAGGITEWTNGNGHADELERLVVVRVEDTIDATLTEQEGGHYQSPPQTHEQAMALVRLVLGRAPQADGAIRWSAPIAGGRRVVTLSEERPR